MENEKKENNKVVDAYENVQTVDKEQTEVEKTLENVEELKLSVADGEELEVELSEADGEELEVELSEAEGEDLEPELQEADGEDFEEELSEEELEEKRRKRKRLLKTIGLSLAGLAAAVYFGFAFYFSSHFFFHTTINGTDQSMKTVEEIEQVMEQQVSVYKIVLEEVDGTKTEIDGNDIDLTYVKGDELTKLVKAQNIFLWPVSLWKNQEIEASVGVNYDETKLDEYLNGLPMMQPENQKAPVAAYPEYDGEKFSVKAEDLGSQIITEVFKEKVATYISGFQNAMNMI